MKLLHQSIVCNEKNNEHEKQKKMHDWLKKKNRNDVKLVTFFKITLHGLNASIPTEVFSNIPMNFETVFSFEYTRS